MKKGFQICTVVQGKNLETLLKNLKKAQTSAEMVELRADSIGNFTIEDIVLLKKATKLPVVFTFRHEKEGGLFKGTVIKQKAILKKAFDLGFTYVDVAYDNPILKELSAKEKTQLLVSYHNYEGTPSIKQLTGILTKMRSVKPALIKMVTFVRKWDNISTLIALLNAKKGEEKLVVIGMGEKGEITRLTFPLMGSHIAFVAMKGEEKIAPGMLTKEDFEPITRYFNK